MFDLPAVPTSSTPASGRTILGKVTSCNSQPVDHASVHLILHLLSLHRLHSTPSADRGSVHSAEV